MSKLPIEYQFLDLSDYGRTAARRIADSLINTSVTPLQVTTWFIISGLLAVGCILKGYYVAAAFFLIIKSILDAADGELSRLKNTPSYVGRYYDSIADIILNFLFFLTFWFISDNPIFYMFLAFAGVQLQGTLYNYYYVILRNTVNGDKTSRIFEAGAPKAMKGETQRRVSLYYKIYNLLYIVFDKTIYWLDKPAINSRPFPNWYMTLLSTFGLGFQLLIMAAFLLLRLEAYVIPFFIAYSLMIPVFIGVRRFVLT
jgi:NADH:ubiquinone oxidoreductase subunit 3 (subunit A)